MNIFQMILETFIERRRFSTYYLEKDLTEIFDFNKTKQMYNYSNRLARI